MKEKFNQQEYIKEFNKKNYKNIGIRLSEKERDEFNILIKKNGFNSYHEFITKCIEIMKSQNNVIKK